MCGCSLMCKSLKVLSRTFSSFFVRASLLVILCAGFVGASRSIEASAYISNPNTSKYQITSAAYPAHADVSASSIYYDVNQTGSIEDSQYEFTYIKFAWIDAVDNFSLHTVFSNSRHEDLAVPKGYYLVEVILDENQDYVIGYVCSTCFWTLSAEYDYAIYASLSAFSESSIFFVRPNKLDAESFIASSYTSFTNSEKYCYANWSYLHDYLQYRNYKVFRSCVYVDSTWSVYNCFNNVDFSLGDLYFGSSSFTYPCDYFYYVYPDRMSFTFKDGYFAYSHVEYLDGTFNYGSVTSLTCQEFEVNDNSSGLQYDLTLSGSGRFAGIYVMYLDSLQNFNLGTVTDMFMTHTLLSSSVTVDVSSFTINQNQIIGFCVAPYQAGADGSVLFGDVYVNMMGDQYVYYFGSTSESHIVSLHNGYAEEYPSWYIDKVSLLKTFCKKTYTSGYASEAVGTLTGLNVNDNTSNPFGNPTNVQPTSAPSQPTGSPSNPSGSGDTINNNDNRNYNYNYDYSAISDISIGSIFSGDGTTNMSVGSALTSGLGLLGDDGTLALMSDAVTILPAWGWALIAFGIGAMVVIAVLKFIRG